MNWVLQCEVLVKPSRREASDFSYVAGVFDSAVAAMEYADGCEGSKLNWTPLPGSTTQADASASVEYQQAKHRWTYWSFPHPRRA